MEASREEGGRFSPFERSVLFGVLFFLSLLAFDSWGQASFLSSDLPPGGSGLIENGIDACMSDITRFFITVFFVYLFGGVLFGTMAHLAALGAVGEGRYFRLVFGLYLFGFVAYMACGMAVVHPQFFAIKPIYSFFPVHFLTAHTRPWMYDLVLALFLVVHAALPAWRYRAKIGDHKKAVMAYGCAVLVTAIVIAGLEKPPGRTGGAIVIDPARPHVFFYCIDALRMDRTGGAGYRRDITPNIDSFMDESVVFENVFTPLAKTYPSWVSFLTSTGIEENGLKFSLPARARRQPDLVTIAGVLRDAGYATSFHTDDSRYSYMEEWAGFDEISQPEPGFMNYFSEYSYYYLLVGKLANTRIGNLLFPMTKHNHALTFTYSPDVFYQDFTAFIARQARKGPVASFSHHVGVHYPGAAPYPYYGMFTDPAYRGGNKYMYRVYFMTDLDEDRFGDVRDSNQHNQDLYDGMVKMMDDYFGEFASALRDEGLYDESMIVLFSDHGEHFNEEHSVFKHSLPMHGVALNDDYQNRCFLAMKPPKSMSSGIRFRTIPEMARIMDAGPTALDLMGLPLADGFHGANFGPRIRGMAPALTGLDVYMENDINPGFLLEPNGLTISASMPQLYQLDEGMRTLGVIESFLPAVFYVKDRAVRTDKWKLVRVPKADGPVYRLFNPNLDPHHLHNLAAENPDVLAELKSLMESKISSDELQLMSMTVDEMKKHRIGVKDGE